MINVPQFKWFVGLKKQAKKEVIWLILLGVIGYLYMRNDNLRDRNELLQKEKEAQIIQCQNERNADKAKADNKINEFLNFQLEKSNRTTDSLLRVIKEVTDYSNKTQQKIERLTKEIK